jgi:hypothetical protein
MGGVMVMAGTLWLVTKYSVASVYPCDILEYLSYVLATNKLQSTTPFKSIRTLDITSTRESLSRSHRIFTLRHQSTLFYRFFLPLTTTCHDYTAIHISIISINYYISSSNNTYIDINYKGCRSIPRVARFYS